MTEDRIVMKITLQSTGEEIADVDVRANYPSEGRTDVVDRCLRILRTQLMGWAAAHPELARDGLAIKLGDIDKDVPIDGVTFDAIADELQ